MAESLGAKLLGGGWHPHKPAGRWATSPTVGHVDGRAEDLPEYSSQSDALRTAVWPHEELGAGSHQLSGMEILTQISFDLGGKMRHF